MTDEIEKLMEKTMLRFKRLTLIMVSLVVLSTGTAWLNKMNVCQFQVWLPEIRRPGSLPKSAVCQVCPGVSWSQCHPYRIGKACIRQWPGRFPMASTYKIPIAVQLLTLVDQGSLKWGQMVKIRQTDLRPGSGVLSNFFISLGWRFRAESF